MNRTTPRTARRGRGCDDCRGRIATGDRHLEHVAAPYHDDLENPRWWRMSECSACATRYGRGHLLATTSDLRSEGDQ